MFEKNGVVYATPNRRDLSVSSVRSLGGFLLLVQFSNGDIRVFDGARFLDMPAFAPLKDVDLFNDFAIDHGALTWKRGTIDVSSAWLFEMSVAYTPSLEQ